MGWLRFFRARGDEEPSTASAGRVFAERAKALGGWIEDEAALLDHFHHQTRMLVETRLARARASQTNEVDARIHGSVSFHFIRNISVNAIAFGQKRHNFIAFHAGVPPIFAALSRVVACWSAIEPELGPGIDVPPAELVELLLSLAAGHRDAQVEQTVDLLLEEVEAPGQRSILDRELLGAMLAFMAHHELAHIVRGHVDLLALQGLPATVLESTRHGAEGGGRLRQWMELDADAWAVAFMVSEAVPPHLLPHLPLDDIRLRLRRLIVALGMVFMMLEPEPRSPLQAAASAHPYTPTRLSHGVGLAVEHFIELTGRDRDDLIPAATSALQDLAEIHVLAGRDFIGRLKDDERLIDQELAAIRREGPPDGLGRALKLLATRVAKP